MLNKISIGAKLSILILASVFAIFAGMYIYHYYVSRSAVMNIVMRESHKTALATVNRIEEILGAVERIAGNMVNFAAAGDMTPKEVHKYLSATVEYNDIVFGATMAFEPFALDSSKRLFAPYYYRSEGEVKYADLSDPDYYYPKWHWYTRPRDAGKAGWSEPYFDEGAGNCVMTTYSAPIYKNRSFGREFVGVVTNDLSLAWMRRFFDSMSTYKSSYFFLISKDGTFISHPDSSLIMKETMYTMARRLGDSTLARVADSMTAGRTGLTRYRSGLTGVEGFIYYMPLRSADWSLGILFSDEEVLADMNDLNREIVYIGIAGFVLLFFIIILISASITRPLRNATRAAEEIAEGKLDQADRVTNSFLEKSGLEKYLKKGTKNESIRLFAAIRKMAANLNSLISQVQHSGSLVSSSTSEIAASARELESTAAEQAASTKEVTATSKSISDTAGELVNTTSQVGENVSTAASSAESGKADLAQMKETMDSLSRATRSIAKKLSIINDKANKISSVVTTINNISDQTNLLSLNAAVEAEKAGEYGKGFSVVAREISRLSEQTAVATDDIEYMVSEMQDSVRTGVDEMDSFGREIGSSVDEVLTISSQLSAIIDMVNNLKPQFKMLDDGIHGQSEGAGQISEAMDQLADASEQTRQSLSEFKRATEQLNDVVSSLQDEVSKFKVKEDTNEK
jgi:methyl-accepting chemotaxis protein WspA